MPTALLVETVEKAKEAICQDSIDFVQKQVELVGCARLRKYVVNPRVVESKGRRELPFFHMTQVIFQRAKAEKIPILLKARNISSHPLEKESYECSALLKSDGSTYKVSPVLSEDMQSRVIVIEGFSEKAIDALKTPEYVDNILLKSGGILRLIDLNTAQHGQYTDQMENGKGVFQAIPGIEPDEEGTLISLFEEAVLKGFSLSNPKEFCVDHVFCDLLANQRAG